MIAPVQASTALVPVTAAPAFDPGARRLEMTVPEGWTVEAIVLKALSGATDATLDRVRVHLATADGTVLVLRANWRRVRPRQGVHVVVRVVAGKTALRSILQVLVSVASAFVAPYLSPFLTALGFSPTIANALVTLGLTAAGGLLINALIPPVAPQSRDQESPRYSITGWRNQLTPDAPVPAVAGRHRMAPPFAARSYTEIVGDLQYVRSLFCVGYGPVTIGEIRIGDTPAAEFDEVELEVREGYAADDKVMLYPEQVIEEQFGVDLRYERPKDNLGNPLPGSAPVEEPVLRVSAADAAEASVILVFPGGLVAFTDEGVRVAAEVDVRVRHRPLGSQNWAAAETFTIRHATTEVFFREHRISFADRGRHEVEVTRLTQNSTSAQRSDRLVLSALQSRRPEYPVAIGRPMALIAARVKATYQLNGPLDTLNCIVQRICLDWDAVSGGWITRPTRNPASLFRWILEELSAKPQAAGEIDLDGLADWHVFCADKGLKYDAVLEGEASLLERLAACAAAGRASPRWDGVRWGVVIDRPQSLVVDHVNPRNARALRWERGYLEPPDAFRVPFLDETNDWQSAERIVPFPGFFGDISVTEELPLPGKTDPDEIWREARRRQYEILHRPDRFSAVQDGAVRVATRGDLVMASFDMLETTMAAARVRRVSGQMVEIDEMVAFEAGNDYAIRFRVADEDDPVGDSVVSRIATAAGEHSVLTVLPGGTLPATGDIVHIGPATTDSLPLIVRATEAAEDFAVGLSMVPAAPQIDELTDAEVPPAWDGRVGELAPVVTTPPAAPVWVQILTGIAGTGSAGSVVATVRPGTGSMAPVSAYLFEHRIDGGAWVTQTVSVATASLRLDGLTSGSQLDLRARARSSAGVEGPFTGTATVIVDAGDAPLPASILSVTIAASPGHALITLTTGTGTTGIKIYRQTGSGGVLDRDTDFVRAVAAGGNVTVQVIDGDGTRVNQLGNPGLDSGADWTPGGGWSIAGGVATHAPGVASQLSQPALLDDGATYVVSLDVAGRTAGDVTPHLTGGAGVTGTAVSVDGFASDELVADAGADTFLLAASAGFDGSVDTVALYRKTAACLPPGQHTWWFEPINADGAAGPLSGPFVQTVR